MIPTHKPCSKCKKPKPLDEFYKRKTGKYGREPLCKKCKNAQSKLWSQTNPERAAAISRKYVAANPEKVSQTRKKYREANREKVREMVKKSYYKHPEKNRARNKRWRQAHPEYGKDWKRANPAKKLAYEIKSNLKYPEKYAARLAVRYAVKRKELPHVSTLECRRCGKQACDYHHHRGYAKEFWLDVIPVCRACHRVLDYTSK